MDKDNWLFPVIATLLVIIVGAGVGYVLENIGHSQASGSNEYHLNLVITTNNYYNASVGYQPAYFVLSGGKLVSSENITLPSNTLIMVTIFCFDAGNGTPAPQFLKVAGTTGNQEFIINNTNVNSTGTGSGINVVGGKEVSSVNQSVVAHTFTIINFFGSGSDLNIPVPESSVVQASFNTGSSGTFAWQCEVPCGTGSSGWDGSMASAGWMQGNVIVS